METKSLSNLICTVMKFSFIQLFLICTSLSLIKANDAVAQEILDQKINLKVEAVPLKTALKKIEKKSKVFFTYRPELIRDLEEVNINAEETSLKNVLQDLLHPFDIVFKAYGNSNIVLTKSAGEDVFRLITGTVSDESGEPLVGATILVKGTGQGTTTDIDGSFSINMPDDANLLVVSYTGYNDKEIDVTGLSSVSVVMEGGVLLESVTVLGSRGKPRTNVDRPVPIDVINARELQSTGQADIGQSLHYSAPSFSAVKFGINDLAPLVDPASLRGLSPDQTLLLINGKRRHKVAFFSNNAGVGKGQLANDINSIPSAAVKRVEILRDGAAAQYGSDAIAGVMNLQLNDAREGGSIRMYYGATSTSPTWDGISNGGPEGEKIYGDDPVVDGQTISASANFGLPWGDDGFVNTTFSYFHAEPSDRSGAYSHSSGWFTDEQVAAAGVASDEELQRIRGIDPDRAVLGTAENTNTAFFLNAGKPINDNWDFYGFGGVTFKEVIGGVFTRTPARTSRAVLEIFPDGYNPEVPSELTDFQLTSGIKGDLGNDWGLDFSLGHSENQVELFARNTVNPSLGALSPTFFFTGALGVAQTLINVDATKTFGNTTLAIGSELRFESFQQSQGQVESYLPGEFRDTRDIGSSGREGFTARTDGEFRRNNRGIYAEVESDITDEFLVAAAIRLEDYSDFGTDFSYKLASRYKINSQVGVRGSINRSFRAPGLAQYEYSNFSQISFDNDGNSVVEPILPIRDPLVQQAFGFSNLNPETSFDIAAGLTASLDGGFTFTIDAYQVNIDDRILALGGINPADFAEFSGTNFDEITVFTNAVDTRTRGLDIVASYRNFLSETSNYGVTIAANFNSTVVDGINLPSRLSSLESDLTTANNDIVYLTDGTPKRKIIGTIDYKIGKIGLLLRSTNFGAVSEPRLRDDAGNPQILSAKTVFDFSITGHLNDQFSVTLGANNFTDVYPDMLSSTQVRNEVIYSRRVNQFGTLGRFWNLALNFNF